LLPLQILWLNLLTDTFPALALAVEPAEPGLMRQPPRDPRAALLSAPMIRSILGYGALIAACSLAAYAWGGSTLAFLTLALAQVFHLGNARSAAPVTAWHRAVSNRYALAAVALAVALQAAAMHYPPLTRVLGVTPPDARGWLVAVTLAMVPALVGQTAKLLRRRP
jgi:Ca2+-transporting ATPase